MKLRGYYVHNNDDDQYGIAVVAATSKQAKQIVHRSGEIIYGDTSWIALRSSWCRDADVDGLEAGIVTDDRDALIRGLYGSLDGHPCDGCGRDDDTVRCYSGRALCKVCIEKEYDKTRSNDHK
jgi:hypothetical protein